MKIISAFLILFLSAASVRAQEIPVIQDSIPHSYFITGSRDEWIRKAIDLQIGITKNDPIPVIISKIEKYVITFQPDKAHPDDPYAREAILQTIKSFREGGYGIGAILTDKNGKILARNHNSQIQENRSDLHGEMALLTGFEESRKSGKYMNEYLYLPGLVVFSSAEPCPMCLIRLASAGVTTRYVCPGPDDGMANRLDCLPSSWRELTHKYPCTKANTSTQLQKIAHLMFFSYLLDNRGPK
jgi:tRNA(Arg) A34 adenosine deaminase TadA